MKNVLVLLFMVISLGYSYSQEFLCSRYVIYDKDKMDDSELKSSIDELILRTTDGRSGIGIWIMKLDSAIVLSCRVIDNSICIENGSKIIVLFRDGERIELSNYMGDNCDGMFTFCLAYSFPCFKYMDKFSSKKVEAIRVYTINNSYEHFDIENNLSERFRRIVWCLKNNNFR